VRIVRGDHGVKSWRKIIAFLLIVAAVIAFDRVGKQLAIHYLSDGLLRSCLAGTVRLEYHTNPGAFLGLGSELPEEIRTGLLLLITGAVLIWLSVVLIRETGFGLAATGLSLVWAGGFSNIIDRLVYGRVVDFMDVGVGAFRTGMFNPADVAIMAGIPVILIGWWRWRSTRRQQKIALH
jgi:signal peptidase II